MHFWDFHTFWPCQIERILGDFNADYFHFKHNAWSCFFRHLKKSPISYSELTVKSVKAWLDIVIYLGLKCEPILKDYWSWDSFFRCLMVKNVISRDRFLSILRNIHLVDNKLCTNRSNPQFDKLGKVHWLLENFVLLCNKYLNLDKFLIVDEIMVAYKGGYCSFQ